MSDEELIKVLPTLDDGAPAGRKGASAARAAAAQHPLDGTPLRLRTERELLDPLAPAPTQAGAAR